MKKVINLLLTLLVMSCSMLVQYTEPESGIQLDYDFSPSTVGWTVPEPSSDSRILYVSSSEGSDSTGEIYVSGDVNIGDDPFVPTGTIRPFKTYAAAYEQTRDGYPDWILLKRGDEFEESIEDSHRNGRSADERFVVGAYGNSGLSPIFKCGSSTGIRQSSSTNQRYKYFLGLDFYAHTRDPGSSDFVSDDGVSGISLTSQTMNMDHILFEGCKFRFFSGNAISNLSPESGIVVNIEFRRCLFLDNYPPSGGGHSQGLFSDSSEIILDECIFDHNGWYSKSSDNDYGPGTMFNHNTYFQNTRNTMFRNCIFSRGSSMGNKFTASDGDGSSYSVLLQNNLYLDNEIGVSIGFNYPSDGLRLNGFTVEECVVSNPGRTSPTERGVGWGYRLEGLYDSVIRNNLVIDQNVEAVTNVKGITVLGQGGAMDNVEITKNVVYNIKNGRGLVIADGDGNPANTISIHSNEFHLGSGSDFMITYDTRDQISINLRNNKYDDTYEGDRYRTYNGSSYSLLNFNEWVDLADDTSSNTTVDYTGSDMSIEAYMESLGKDADIDIFIEHVRSQGRYFWDDRFTALEVNEYIKARYN